MPEDNSWQTQVLTQLERDGGTTELATEGQVRSVVAVKSNSDPMAFYYLIDLGWIVLCTCRSFRFRTDCSHTRDYSEKGVDTPTLHAVD